MTTAFAFDPVCEPASCARRGRDEHDATAACDHGLSTFMKARPRLFSVAYRVLGNAADAEEIVQDTWLRWQSTDRSVVRDPAAFLVTATTRLAINALQSAHRRHETSLDSPLPEPVDRYVDTGSKLECSESLVIAVRLMRDRLSATERAAYVLREAFDYSYREIATVLRLEEANTRQLVTRARQRLCGGRPATVRAADHHLADRAAESVRSGDLSRFKALFDGDHVVSLPGAAAA